MFQDSTSFSSSSTTPSIPLTTIPYPSYHNYTFNTNHNLSTNTTINHLQSPAISLPTAPSAKSNVANIGSIHLKSTTIKTRSTTSAQPPQYQSESSEDDDSFLCITEERQSNLPFGDLISNPKETRYT